MPGMDETVIDNVRQACYTSKY